MHAHRRRRRSRLARRRRKKRTRFAWWRSNRTTRGAVSLMETDVEVDIAPSHEYEEAMARLAAAEGIREISGGGGGGEGRGRRAAREGRGETNARGGGSGGSGGARGGGGARGEVQSRDGGARTSGTGARRRRRRGFRLGRGRRASFRASGRLDQNQAIRARIPSARRSISCARWAARGRGTLQTRHAVAEDDVGGGGGGRAIRARRRRRSDSRALRGKNRQRRIPTDA